MDSDAEFPAFYPALDEGGVARIGQFGAAAHKLGPFADVRFYVYTEMALERGFSVHIDWKTPQKAISASMCTRKRPWSAGFLYT